MLTPLTYAFLVAADFLQQQQETQVVCVCVPACAGGAKK